MTDPGSSGALGPLRAAAGRREADEERAVRLAADRLLDRALGRLADGDDAAARRFVERALALTAGAAAPGEDDALAVHLFVWDAVRESALGQDGDDRLERAEAAVDDLDGPAREEWLAALRALADEEALPPAAQRRLRARVGRGAPGRLTFAGVAAGDRVPATLALLRSIGALTG